jgi:hypothetical protein
MKFKTTTKLLAMFMFVATTLITSCSSDDDSAPVVNNPGNLSSLTNKWWYDTEDYTADLFFNSNGAYQQKLVAAGQTFITNGTWTWQDESAGVMKVIYTSSNGQLASQALYRFTNIGEHSMTVQQSVNDGASWSDLVDYADAD